MLFREPIILVKPRLELLVRFLHLSDLVVLLLTLLNDLLKHLHLVLVHWLHLAERELLDLFGQFLIG